MNNFVKKSYAKTAVRQGSCRTLFFPGIDAIKPKVAYPHLRLLAVLVSSTPHFPALSGLG